MGFRNLPEMKPTNKPQFAGVGFDFGGGETDHPVTSVNGETGAVVLDAADVGALPSDTSIPTKTSDLVNDSGFVESDIIAPVETTSTASQAYTAGQYFINSLGQLCRVTVDIASGGTITIGTNCVVEPVGSALTKLNSNKVIAEYNITSSMTWSQALNNLYANIPSGIDFIGTFLQAGNYYSYCCDTYDSSRIGYTYSALGESGGTLVRFGFTYWLRSTGSEFIEQGYNGIRDLSSNIISSGVLRIIRI